MSNPTVCAICLVNGRPKMTKRAIRCFMDQTYGQKNMLIFDTAAIPEPWGQDGRGVNYWWGENKPQETIGALRNRAAYHSARYQSDILIHWDSDDWSHPNRIAEQVALLQASGKDCVGYRDMLFWDETPGQFCSAWLYENKDTRRPIGTSLCYWRKTWERRPFADLPKNAESTSEYCDWLREVDALGFTSIETAEPGWTKGPRMIASIHGGNTTHYDPAGYVAAQQGTSWERAAAWDDYCRKEMQL